MQPRYDPLGRLFVVVGLGVAAIFAIIGTMAWWPLLKVSWSYWFG
jgi:hypothetical protein